MPRGLIQTAALILLALSTACTAESEIELLTSELDQEIEAMAKAQDALRTESDRAIDGVDLTDAIDAYVAETDVRTDEIRRLSDRISDRKPDAPQAEAIDGLTTDFTDAVDDLVDARDALSDALGECGTPDPSDAVQDSAQDSAQDVARDISAHLLETDELLERLSDEVSDLPDHECDDLESTDDC